MNSFNALGFLALGSVMNALPALTPSLVARGPAILADLTPSAVWLHFMGLVVGLIGGGWLVRESLTQLSLARTAAAEAAAAVPERASTPIALPEPARAAA
ncbi:hypothetical protein DB347_02815 [Opitutaceae bacterium EW11]|nr:hypothetical protein DB347_02815 [Opitutaceae bacterium EW11]